MLIKYKLKGTTSTHGIVFDNENEVEVSNEIGNELVKDFPHWFEDITPKKATKEEVKADEVDVVKKATKISK